MILNTFKSGIRDRAGCHPLAEDLTAETFLAAVDAVRAAPSPALTTGWLIGVARHKAEEHPEIGARAPRPGGVPVSLVLTVADVDDVVGSAVAAGARLDRGPYEGYGHRNATVTDPYGHRWMLQAPLPAALAEPAGTALRRGDIGYASLWVPDVVRAATFYGAVLGLEYVPDHDSRGRQAVDLTPPQGLWESADRPTLFCSYVVDDAAEAVARVRAAGGQASEPVRQPYGMSADCVDTDGVRFAVHQPPAASLPAAGRSRTPRR